MDLIDRKYRILQAIIDDYIMTDYLNFGPNNEVYLAPGQRVAFLLTDGTAPAKDQNGNILFISITI